MLKTAVKYFIFDYCIKLLFDRWSINFNNTTISKPKVGDFIRQISHISSDEHYYNCIIKNVVSKITKNGDIYYMVYFTYSTSNGDSINEWREEMNEYLDNDEYLDELAQYIKDENIDISELGDDISSIEKDISNLINDEDVEYMEYPDMICINSMYYNFFQ